MMDTGAYCLPAFSLKRMSYTQESRLSDIRAIRIFYSFNRIKIYQIERNPRREFLQILIAAGTMWVFILIWM